MELLLDLLFQGTCCFLTELLAVGSNAGVAVTAVKLRNDRKMRQSQIGESPLDKDRRTFAAFIGFVILAVLSTTVVLIKWLR